MNTIGIIYCPEYDLSILISVTGFALAVTPASNSATRSVLGVLAEYLPASNL